MAQPVKYVLYKAFLGVSIFLISSIAIADYIVVSDIKGQVCTGFVIDVCSMKKVDAVGDGSGTLYLPSDRYESVTDYRERDNRCWIKIKGSGILGSALSFFSSTQFYTLKNGEYEEIKPEYLTFECVRL